MHPVVREIEKKNQKPAGDIPDFRPGDTVRVSLEIIEGKNRRVQDIEGVVIARRGGGMRESFTVRRVSFGVGMERTFPIHSPRIQGIKVMRRGKVRRSKLYYLRNLRGKKARITERRTTAKDASKDGGASAPERAASES